MRENDISSPAAGSADLLQRMPVDAKERETIIRRSLAEVDPITASRNSFRDYHVRGLDYLCLRRSEHLTVKLYFIDGDSMPLNVDGYLVGPHDHSYDFDTLVVTGAVTNYLFSVSTGFGWQRFDYESPMRGGDGFRHIGETGLRIIDESAYSVGAWYSMRHDQIHTIRPTTCGRTVMALLQYRDAAKPLTAFFSREMTAPNLDGLYSSMTVERAAELITEARALLVRSGESRNWTLAD